MGLSPKLKRPIGLKTCSRCGGTFGPEDFALTNSVFYADQRLPMCNDCVDVFIHGDDNESDEGNWTRVNKLCQYADVPFVPTEWVKIYEMNPNGAFGRYCAIFSQQEYEDLGWGDYFEEYKRLKENHQIEEVLPEINEQKRKKQEDRWGKNYDQEELNYLDELFNGLMATQNVNGALQTDQALKICKLSLEIDQRIREGSEFDKILASYDKLVKTAEFTPKNVKNINDFDTVGELIKWLEKKGWRCGYYDNVTKDIVDETIKNIQNFNQRLYTNESGIGDDITHRIEMLRAASNAVNGTDSEGYFIDGNQSYDLDNYDNDGYNELIKGQEFDPGAGGKDDD